MKQKPIQVQGNGGISATIIADSINPAGHRLTTMELEYHRFIHSEFMTHRMFSRNAASSRAIPIQTTIDTVRLKPAIPISFGRNKPGMQAKEELVGEELEAAQRVWYTAAMDACNRAQQLVFMNVHKQVGNRILEPFVMMKSVVSFTESDNFFELRNHKDADPHIHELARCMKAAMDYSVPVQKQAGEWHLPYVEDETMKLEDALAISASCCAQVSYRKLDTSLEKAHKIFKQLIESKPVHASPVEHQAMVPREERNWNSTCRNFVGWSQYRSILNV